MHSGVAAGRGTSVDSSLASSLPEAAAAGLSNGKAATESEDSGSQQPLPAPHS